MQTEGQKQKRLSGAGSVLPTLVGVMGALAGSAGELLDQALIAAPNYEIPRRLDRIFGLIEGIGSAVIDVREPDWEKPLSETETLMHEITSASEYMRSVVNCLAKYHGAEKATRAALAELSNMVNLQFKVPINKIKHEGFELQPISFTHDGRPPIHGVVVHGLVDVRTTGSAHVRYKDAISEGYSFALLLRRAAEMLYLQSDLVETVVRQLYREDLAGAGLGQMEPGPTLQVVRALSILSRLLFEGLPNEHKGRVAELDFVDGSVVLVRSRLLRFNKKDAYTVTTSVRHRAGHTFRIPFWQQR